MINSSIENHLNDIIPRWFAVRTKFKSEKVALHQLELNKINAYLPIRQVMRMHSRKKQMVDLPLINSYVFVKITKSEYVKVLETDHVAGFLKFGKNLLSIPEREIDLIRRLIGEDIEVEIEDTSFHTGDWVEVTKGSLLGLRGQLVKEAGKEKFLVALTNSGYSLNISIDTQFLQKIENY